MKNIIYLLAMLLVTGCSGSGGLSTGLGTVTQSQDAMTAEWEAYYMAKMEQTKPVELVKIDIDESGKIKSLTVNQAAQQVEIVQPKRQYSAGWETANRFVDGFWSTAKMAVPVAGVAVVADVVGRRISESQGTVTNTTTTTSDSSTYASDSSNNINTLTDNSNQGNPITTDNSNQGNPITTDNSTIPVVENVPD
jgi:hypothetical protein